MSFKINWRPWIITLLIHVENKCVTGQYVLLLLAFKVKGKSLGYFLDINLDINSLLTVNLIQNIVDGLHTAPWRTIERAPYWIIQVQQNRKRLFQPFHSVYIAGQNFHEEEINKLKLSQIKSHYPKIKWLVLALSYPTISIYEIQYKKTEKLKTNTLLRYFILEDALILLYCDVRTA